MIEPSSSFSQTAISAMKTTCTNAEESSTMYQLSLNRKRMKLELYQLVWLALDSPTFTIENNGRSFTFESFRIFVDRTMVFNNAEQCLLYLQESKKDGIITFLLCYDSLAEILIPQLANYDNIRSIYILCPNQNKQLQRIVENSTIQTYDRKVFETLETLVLDLSKTLGEFKKYEDRMTLTQITNKADGEVEKTTDKEWSWWIKFIEILVHLPYPTDYCRQKINVLKEYYVGNSAQINFINEFQSDYQSQNAIRWYTRDTCKT